METETEIKRGPGRPPGSGQRMPARDVDHRSRAAERLAALRGTLPDENEEVDRFHVPAHLIPDGWSYEWKRHTLIGKEDPAYQTAVERSGWEPVPASRHIGMMPKGYEGPITRDGMILMERPAELTNDAHSRSFRAAKDMVRSKEQQLGLTPAGTLPRDAHAQVKPRISKRYEAIDIPE